MSGLTIKLDDDTAYKLGLLSLHKFGRTNARTQVIEFIIMNMTTEMLDTMGEINEPTVQPMAEEDVQSIGNNSLRRMGATTKGLFTNACEHCGRIFQAGSQENWCQSC